MNKSLAPPVFVSYSREDESFLQRLVADLQAHGIMVWIDKSGIPPGTPDWEDALRAAISTTQAVILIASPHSRSSRYVRDELSLAERYQHRIYPIWVDGTEWIDSIPMGYGRMEYIDARGSRYQSALNDLVLALDTLSVPSQLTEPYSKTYSSPTVREQVSIATPQRQTANPVPQGTPEYSSWHWTRSLTGHIDSVSCVAMSADGLTLASVCRGNSEIKLWEKK